MNSALQALIFDVDGTLAETERNGHRPAFNKAFAAAGLDWDWSVELYGELLEVTGGKERIRHYLEAYRPELSIGGDADAFISSLHLAKNRFYADLLATGELPSRPGVERLLLEARAAGLRLAIATTTTMENVVGVLRHCINPEAPDWFEVIAAGDAVAAKKPAPDVYYAALEALQLRPQHCLALEDSGNGLRAALAANVPTLVTVSEYTVDDDFEGAAAVLNHLGEPWLRTRARSGGLGAATCVDVATLRLIHAHQAQVRTHFGGA